MKFKNPLLIIVALVVVIGIGFTLWGGDQDDTDTTGFVAEETPTPAETTPAKTTAPAVKSPAVKAPATVSSDTRKLENGRYVTTVTLTNSGFQPQIISANRGESVRFLNKSGNAMRVTAGDYQGVPILLGLKQEKSVGLNGVYEMTLTETGVWGYHNQPTPSLMGIIYVK